MNSMKIMLIMIFVKLIVLSGVEAQDYQLIWPLSKSQSPDVITSTFGIRYNPNMGENYKMHKGIDLAASVGDTVFASQDGIVLWNTNSVTGGIMMAVGYDGPNSQYLNMRYLHLQDTILASNSPVDSGIPISLSGNTGGSNGPHLHLEVFPASVLEFPDDAIRENPVRYLPGINQENPPSIILDSTYWFDPGEVDVGFLHIEVNESEMDLSDFSIREWNPTSVGDYCQLTFLLEENTILEYNNSDTPTNTYNSIDTTRDSLQWTYLWCGSNCCTDIFIIPKNFTVGDGSFQIQVIFDPWVPENAYYAYWGIQAVDVCANVAEWGNFNSPYQLIENLDILQKEDHIALDFNLSHCEAIKSLEVLRAVPFSKSCDTVYKAVIDGMITNQRIQFIDSTALVTQSYEYTIKAYGEKDLLLSRETGAYQPLPDKFVLSENYPNPFNPSTKIEFIVPGPEAREVDLTIYNTLGQRVKTLHSGTTIPGRYVKTWTGDDDKGRRVASGLYFYKLSTDSWSASRKMILVK